MSERNIDHYTPDKLFDPELRQAQEDWQNYINSRPWADRNGRTRSPLSGRIIDPDAYFDEARERHYADSSGHGYDNLSFQALARKLAAAEYHQDKTVAQDIQAIIDEKIKTEVSARSLRPDREYKLGPIKHTHEGDRQSQVSDIKAREKSRLEAKQVVANEPEPVVASNPSITQPEPSKQQPLVENPFSSIRLDGRGVNPAQATSVIIPGTRSVTIHRSPESAEGPSEKIEQKKLAPSSEPLNPQDDLALGPKATDMDPSIEALSNEPPEEDPSKQPANEASAILVEAITESSEALLKAIQGVEYDGVASTEPKKGIELIRKAFKACVLIADNVFDRNEDDFYQTASRAQKMALERALKLFNKDQFDGAIDLIEDTIDDDVARDALYKAFDAVVSKKVDEMLLGGARHKNPEHDADSILSIKTFIDDYASDEYAKKLMYNKVDAFLNELIVSGNTSRDEKKKLADSAVSDSISYKAMLLSIALTTRLR